MSSDGEDLSDGDNSSESNMVFEELELGSRVGVAMHAGAPPDMVCIDTGCNRVILIEGEYIEKYKGAQNAVLKTATYGAHMRIAGRGSIGESSVLHVPDASANLMSSRSIAEKGCRIVLGQTDNGWS